MRALADFWAMAVYSLIRWEDDKTVLATRRQIGFPKPDRGKPGRWGLDAGAAEFLSASAGYGRGERARDSGTRQIRGCAASMGSRQGPVDLVLTA